VEAAGDSVAQRRARAREHDAGRVVGNLCKTGKEESRTSVVVCVCVCVCAFPPVPGVCVGERVCDLSGRARARQYRVKTVVGNLCETKKGETWALALGVCVILCECVCVQSVSLFMCVCVCVYVFPSVLCVCERVCVCVCE